MDKFLQDYGEYIVGIPSLIISVLVAIWVYRKQNKKKNLIYEIESYYDLIPTKLKDSNVRFVFNNLSYENIALLVITFRNTGNVPISINDFQENLKVKFNDETDILDCSLIECYPKNIGLVWKSDKSLLEFEPLIVNPNEYFKLKLLLGNNKNFDVSSRILGISEIKKLDENTFVRQYVFKNFKDIIFKYLIFLGAPYYLGMKLYDWYICPLLNHNHFIRIVILLTFVIILSSFTDQWFDKAVSLRQQKIDKKKTTANKG